MNLGRRIATHRARRRLTQRQLADAAHVSIDVIRKVEQGIRATVRMDTLTAVAHALDIAPAELLDKPRGLLTGEDSEVSHLRRAVLDVVPPTGDDPTIGDTRTALGESWRSYWTGRYADCARRLPTVIAAAKALDQRGVAIHSDALHLAAALLSHLGLDDLASLAIHRAVALAELAEDPLLIAGMHGSRAWLLTRHGLADEAAHVALHAAAAIEPRMSAPVARVAVWGECLRYACGALTRAGQVDAARDLIVLTRTAAARVGAERPDRPWATRVVEKATDGSPLPGLGFGPALTGVTEVSIAAAGERWRQALTLAAGVTDTDALSPAMRARHLVTVAWAQTMEYRSGDAVMTLRRAEQLAPELLAQQSLARAAVAELLPRRRRQRLPGLVGLAERMGVSGAG